MGCGKSKHSVTTDDGALQKVKNTDAGSKNRREVRLEPFPDEKENPDEITKAMAREEAEDGENLKQEMGGKRDDVDSEALPRPEEATESQEMSLLPREEGTEHEALGQKEEQEVKKDDETLEEEKEATLEENKDASPEDEHGDGNKGLAGRLLSGDSPNHYFSSRKDDEALEGILSEYNSPLHVDANKPTQEVPINGERKAKEEPEAAVVAEPLISAVEPAKEEPVAAVVAEPVISAVEPKVLTVDRDQTNPAPIA